MLAGNAGEAADHSRSQSQNGQDHQVHVSAGSLDGVGAHSLGRGSGGQGGSALDVGVAAQVLGLDVAAVVALVAAHSAGPVVVAAGRAGVELGVNAGSLGGSSGCLGSAVSVGLAVVAGLNIVADADDLNENGTFTELYSDKV